MKVHESWLTQIQTEMSGLDKKKKKVRQHVNLQFSDSNKKIQFQQPKN